MVFNLKTKFIEHEQNARMKTSEPWKSVKSVKLRNTNKAKLIPITLEKWRKHDTKELLEQKKRNIKLST